jgi:hypothetical protein
MSLAAGGTVAIGTAGTVATAKATAGAAITAIKAKVVTAVAIAAIGTGAVVTYNNVTTQPTPEPQASETVTVVDDAPPADKSKAADPVDNTANQEWIAFWEDVKAEEAQTKPSPAVTTAEIYEEPAPQPEPKMQAEQPSAPALTPAASPKPPMGMMGRSSRKRRVKDPNDQDQQPQLRGSRGYGGGMRGGRSRSQ